MIAGAKRAVSRRKQHAWVAGLPGVRTTSRPLAGEDRVDVAYVRDACRGELPILIFPGGPGLASVLPYRGLRAKAKKLGLDVVMMEHRGIGLSRADAHGIDLPRESITIGEVIDDAASVLAAEGIEQVVVYGTSYGSYLAQRFGVRHPERVAGMVLDSAMLGASSGLSSANMLRQLFWDGTPSTQRHADAVRRMTDAGVITAAEAGFPLQFLYELGGLPLVESMLTLLEEGRGRRVWRWIQGVGVGEIMTPRPFVMEFDLVGEIAFRELNYGVLSAGGPFQASTAFTDAARHFSPFNEEPFDLVAGIRSFGWPTAIISGDRDIRAPRTVAEQITALVPDSILIPVRDHGHSALDTHPSLALEVARSVADSICASGKIDPAQLPPDPSGARGLMHRVVAARLAVARSAPRRLS